MTGNDQLLIVASAIANARGGRHGIPPITNVYDLLSETLKAEVLDDARAVLAALEREGCKIDEEKPPEILDNVVDLVLAHNPKPKPKKREARRRK